MKLTKNKNGPGEKKSNAFARTNNEALEKWKLRLLNAISITIDEQPRKSAESSTNPSNAVIEKSAESSFNSSNEAVKQIPQADSSSKAWCVCMPEDESERKIVIGMFIASIVILLFVILLACVTGKWIMMNTEMKVVEVKMSD
ncbi:hypothetical protein B9Z55_022413 [Caenorhabditis nigoni]|uniref:Uncharacterized protein n=1 Tax=Caenorhabditis nigoni TaxID=1611254 RepID=A0A2G5SK65_9PELO|nr:hypothetical protein B9Z55_022413 [Caenorhabditis nigoni]